MHLKIQWYTIFTLGMSLLGLILFVIVKSRKLKLFRGHLFSNRVKIMLFISDTKYNIPIKLCKTAGSMHLFKTIGLLTSENVKLKRNKIWDIIEIYWKEVNMTLIGNKINLPKLVTTKIETNSKLNVLSEKTLALLYHVKARIYMIYIGF